MLSLRGFHLFFILVAIVGADLFGVWAVWRFTQTKEALTLAMGIVCILGGLGLLIYAIRFVRRLDADRIR